MAVQLQRFLRRALLRGLIGASAGAVAGALARRGRAPLVAGALTGFATGAAIELPASAVLLAPAGVTLGRAGRPGLVAGAVGSVTALVSTRVWPVAPRTPARARPVLTPLDAEPAPLGDGLTFVVNASAGPARHASPADALREALPRATVVELDPEGGDELVGVLRRASTTARAIGVAGGDGSISAAARVAHDAQKPLVVVPGGTLNHLARDLGLGGVDDAVDAVQHGHVVAVDVGLVDDRAFVNTASFGSYSDLVDARERLEHRVGKWPALMVALVHVLRNGEPVHVELDGRERRLWMVFIGNCRYHPAGFAPAWRERLDDGLLDVRVVGAEHRLPRVRLLFAVLTGHIGRSPVHEAYTTRSLHVRSLDGPLRLACDGETFEGHAEVTVTKLERPLAVYVPRPD